MAASNNDSERINVAGRDLFKRAQYKPEGAVMKTFGFVSMKSAVGWVRKPSSSAMKRRRSRLFQLRKRRAAVATV